MYKNTVFWVFSVTVGSCYWS